MFKKITVVLILSAIPMLSIAQNGTIQENLIFYAPFNDGTEAKVAVGDSKLYTASSRKEIQAATEGLEGSNVVLATGKGRSGDALDFKKKGKSVVFYDAFQNVDYSKDSWSGAISLWLQLDPAVDLEPGYCDPIQITDVSYNDASIWVDFTKDNPRDFRLGVIGDLDKWNPDKIDSDKNPEFEKRLIRVKNPPFERGKWTHIVINFSKLGTSDSLYELFVNGVSQGKVENTGDLFTWEEKNAKIFLGLSYIGLMDEFSVFDKPISQETIQKIYKSSSLESLLKG